MVRTHLMRLWQELARDGENSTYILQYLKWDTEWRMGNRQQQCNPGFRKKFSLRGNEYGSEWVN